MANFLARYQTIKNSCDHIVIAVEDVSDLWPTIKNGFEKRFPLKRACLNNKTRNPINVDYLPAEFILTRDARLRSRFLQKQYLFWFREPYATVVLVTCEESLAFMFEMAHLHEDALREYFELEICYTETGAVATAVAEVTWVKSLLRELGVLIPQTPTIYCDNVGTTYLNANPILHSRMKHIAIDFHFVRDKVQSGELRVSHVSSADQLVDALMKPLTR